MMTTTTVKYTARFPGRPQEVRAVRRAVAGCLSGCPVIAEAVLVASELAANAVLHSASRDAWFTVRCETFSDHVWIECTDLGGPWVPRQPDGRPHGLDILTSLCGDCWGIVVNDDGHRTCWARVDY